MGIQEFLGFLVNHLTPELPPVAWESIPRAGRPVMTTYMHACMHACMQAYIHTYIHTCIRAYVHTYIHTYIQHNTIQYKTN